MVKGYSKPKETSRKPSPNSKQKHSVCTFSTNAHIPPKIWKNKSGKSVVYLVLLKITMMYACMCIYYYMLIITENQSMHAFGFIYNGGAL